MAQIISNRVEKILFLHKLLDSYPENSKDYEMVRDIKSDYFYSPYISEIEYEQAYRRMEDFEEQKAKQSFFIKRLLFWVISWLGLSWYFYSLVIESSQKAYDAGDLSAFAWTAFLPFVLPIFMMQGAICVGPLVILTEIWLWLYRRRK